MTRHVAFAGNHLIHLYLTHLRNNKRDVILSTIFVVACVVLQTVCLIPTSRRIIDEGVALQDLGVIYRIGARMALYSVLAMLCTVGSSYFSSRATAGFAASLRKGCYDKVMSLSEQDVARYGTATLLTRTTTDVNLMTQLLLNVLRSCMTVPAIILSVLLLILFSNPMVFVILTSTFALTIAFLIYFGGRSIARYDRLQQRMDHVTALTREKISGVRTIRAYGNQALEEERLREEDAAIYEAAVYANRAGTILSPIALLLMNWVVVLIYLVGSRQLRDGLTSISSLLVIFQYVSYFIAALAIIPFMMNLLPKVTVAASRIRELLDETPGQTADAAVSGQTTAGQAATKTAAPSFDASGDITFEHVTFGYNPESPVVSDLCLTAHAGKVTAIIGATGSGKTTLVNLMQGLYRPDSGTIRIGGQDIAEVPVSALCARMAYVTQRAQIFQDTVRNNITAYRQDVTEEQLREACRIAAFDEVLDLLPWGLDTVMAQDGMNLSGGQRQRLGLARAFTKDAPVYLFDDAMSSLDARTERSILENMRACPQDRTVIVVAQKIRTIMDADSIIVMEDGRIADQGSHKELLARCPVYQEIYATQTASENDH